MSVRVAVIGAGHMGRFHADKVAELSRRGGVELVGVVDREKEIAEKAALPFGVPAYADFRALLGAADAFIVAVPTIAHFEIVDFALRSGIHVLVEKPIAATLGEAERLIEGAAASDRVLQVGHLEWFNAAMRTVRSLIRRPRFVEAHRLGPFPARATDVDVVRDLMIHDIDIVQRLVGEEPSDLEAIGVPVLTDKVDIANARLRFANGCVANFTASRVSPQPVRKIRFFQADGYFSIDFLEQAVVIARRVRDAETGERKVDLRRLGIDREDALLTQLEFFIGCIRDGRKPEGAGAPAVAALRTALRVVEAIPPLDVIDDDDLPVGG